METVSLWTALPGFLSGDEGKHKQVYGLAQGLGKGALRCENCPHCLGPFLLQTPFLPFQAGLGGSMASLAGADLPALWASWPSVPPPDCSYGRGG